MPLHVEKQSHFKALNSESENLCLNACHHLPIMPYSLLLSQYLAHIWSTQQDQQTFVGGIKQMITQSSKEIHDEGPLGRNHFSFISVFLVSTTVDS